MSNLIDDLHGKHILVAGASSGIGEACAGFLAENGLFFVGVDRCIRPQKIICVIGGICGY